MKFNSLCLNKPFGSPEGKPMSLFQFLSHLRKKIMQGLVYIIQLLVQRLLEHKGHMYLYATVLEAPKLEK